MYVQRLFVLQRETLAAPEAQTIETSLDPVDAECATITPDAAGIITAINDALDNLAALLQEKDWLANRDFSERE